MLDDFTALKYKSDHPIRIYPLGDVHIGSKEFNAELFDQWVRNVADDPDGVVVIVGDLMNMGLKNSKSNIYEEIMTPMEQKEKCYELLKPIANKIIGGCSGNHEYRMVKEAGNNPLYDVFCRLQIEDKYRENICFLKINCGEYQHNPITYGVVLTHGTSKNRDERWNLSVDGCDLFINGHTHEACHKPNAKIVFDVGHDRVSIKPYHEVVVTPFQSYGGYAVRGKYRPSFLGQFQTITLDNTRKRVIYTLK